jgi:hypothetical protein
MSYFATLLAYDFTIKYWPGSKNCIADALSRRYDEVINAVEATPVTNKREQWWQAEQERRVAYALGRGQQAPSATCASNYRPPGVEDFNEPTDARALTIAATRVIVEHISSTLEEIQAAYAEDKWFQPIWTVLQAERELIERLGNGDFDDWEPAAVTKVRKESMREIRKMVSTTEWERSRRFEVQTVGTGAVLMHKDNVCIPDCSLRRALLHETHDSLAGGHMSGAKMNTRLRDMGVYWRRMEGDCNAHVRGCSTCLRVKPNNQKPVGLLHQLDVPKGRWESIGIDWITGLPPSGDEGYDAIMSIVDRFTKRAHFLPVCIGMGAEETAEIFVDRYFRLHGVPTDIVSDRDPRFIADFWQAFTKSIGTNLSMSSSAHPQTDGQTEKVNSIVTTYLKCFMTRLTNNGQGWHKLLPLAEFAYNSSPQKSLEKSPFIVDLGYMPPSKLQLLGAAVGASTNEVSAKGMRGKEFAEHLESLLLAAHDDLEAARDAQRADANAKRRDHDFKEGDMVLVDTPKDHITYSNIVTDSTKLQHKFGGPHRILWIRGTAAKVDLGTDVDIHPVLHVSRLRHDTTDRSRPQEPIPPLRLARKGGAVEGVCEVLRIMDHSSSGTNKKNLRYLIEWDDYTGDMVWLELEALKKASELVEEYHEKHGLGAVDWDARRRAQAEKARKKKRQYWA